MSQSLIVKKGIVNTSHGFVACVNCIFEKQAVCIKLREKVSGEDRCHNFRRGSHPHYLR